MSTKRLVATGHGGPQQRVRLALEQALPELNVDRRVDAQEAIRAANLDGHVVQLGRELDGFLDRIAAHVVEEARPLIARIAAVHERANRASADRIADAPRVDGTFRGPVPA